MTDIVERLNQLASYYDRRDAADSDAARPLATEMTLHEIGDIVVALSSAAAEIERLRADKASRDLWAIAAVTQFDDIAEAVRAEREACAILADERGAVTVAAAIRSRGDNTSHVADKPLTDSDQITD